MRDALADTVYAKTESLHMMADGVSFAIETTLATRSYKNLVLKAQKKGYNVSLLFFWLKSPEVACRRVAHRVAEGGHNIPIETIFRRYWLGLENLFRIFMPIVDNWALYDNNNETSLIADTNGITNHPVYSQIINSICQRKNNWK
ncbi:MAG: zeta toxin family protein [Muribaculaceae bacterium]|nr:zeta toxin family protein [Muribaculaceae bacterium]